MNRTRKDEQDAQAQASQFNETLRITGEAAYFAQELSMNST